MHAVFQSAMAGLRTEETRASLSVFGIFRSFDPAIGTRGFSFTEDWLPAAGVVQIEIDSMLPLDNNKTVGNNIVGNSFVGKIYERIEKSRIELGGGGPLF